MKRTVKFIFGMLALCSSAMACGPTFPIRMLLSNDSFHLRAESIRRVSFELDQYSRGEGKHRAHLPEQEEWDVGAVSEGAMRDMTYDAAKGDFSRALELDASLDSEVRERLFEGFVTVREMMGYDGDVLESQTQAIDGFLVDLLVFAPESGKEFELYLRGALYFRLGNLDEARGCWEALLELPAEQRRYRSVWAAYMLGRLNADASINWYARTRALAEEGFEDSTGLAAASFGWEAKSAMDEGRYEDAFELYLRHYRCGYDSAVQSLDTLARRVLADGDYDLEKAVENVALSGLLTDHLVRSWNRLYERGKAIPGLERWLDAVSANEKRSIEHAGRFALLAYRHGDDDGASRWIAQAREDDEFAIWIQAKLSLKAGKIDEGLMLLDLVKRVLAEKGDTGLSQGSREIGGLAGVAMTTRSDFEGALAAFLSGGHWLDAAYIAEVAMSSDQLVEFMESEGFASLELNTPSLAESRSLLRLLCGRRLVREGRCVEAMDYFENGTRKHVESLEKWISLGSDSSAANEDRARAFWEAALIERKHGMDLLATELFPDYACVQGSYQLEDERLVRSGLSGNVVNQPGETELERARVLRDQLSDRFHYRYLAAALAWKAAGLLPDEDKRTAAVLASAGNWLKRRDPEAADPFFKALVIRCGRTELGERAMQRNWIPEVSEDVAW